MRTVSLIASVVALLCAAFPAAGQDAAIAHSPPLGVTLESCVTNALPAGRVTTFAGSMPALGDPGIRMRMRFDLERRRAGERLWRRVRGVPGFGVWERAEPGVAGFVFHKRVDGLHVPAGYRALVRFRWDDAGGSVVRRARERTAVCQQPDLRPNLVPGRLTAFLDVQPELAVYVVQVRNTGRSFAGPFSVRVGQGTVEVAGLAPGSERAVLVPASICAPGSTVLARVDADGRVDESEEDGNAQLQRCPLPLE